MVDRWEVAPKLVVALGVAVAAYVAIGSTVFPQGPDQAIFSWVGTVILDGGVPYRDAVDIKGPLTFYLYAAVLGVLGRNEFGIRLFDLCVVLGACVMLGRVTLRLCSGDSLAATCAALFFCLMYYGGGYADTAEPEGWGGVLILAAVLILMKPPSNAAFSMSAVGAIIAAATLIKPTFAAYMVIPCAFGVGGAERRSPPFWPELACIASFSVVILIAILLLMQAHAFGDLLDTFGYIYSTYEPGGGASWGPAIHALVKSALGFGLLIPYILVPLALWSLRSAAVSREIRLMLSWLAVSTLVVIIQRRFWHDHCLPVALSLSPFVGVACGYLMVRWPATRSPHNLRSAWVGILAVLGTFFPVAKLAVSENSQWPLYVSGVESKAQYVSDVMKPFNVVKSPFNYLALKKVSSYIEQSTADSDELVIWGWDVSIFLMSHRRSATRFGVFQQLIDSGVLLDKFRATFISEVSQHRPRYIIVDTRGAWLFDEGTGLKLLKEFPEFDRLIRSHYTQVAQVDAYQIWRRFGQD